MSSYTGMRAKDATLIDLANHNVTGICDRPNAARWLEWQDLAREACDAQQEPTQPDYHPTHHPALGRRRIGDIIDDMPLLDGWYESQEGNWWETCPPAPFGVQLTDNALFITSILANELGVNNMDTAWYTDFDALGQVRYWRPSRGRAVVIWRNGIPGCPSTVGTMFCAAKCLVV